MDISEMYNKSRFLALNANKKLYQELFTHIKNNLRQKSDSGRETLVSEAMNLDICFFLAKHKMWRHNYWFSEFVASYLSQSYQCSFAAAKNLLNGAIEILDSCDPQKKSGSEENDFLKYLMVKVALHHDVKELAQIVGFNEAFLLPISRLMQINHKDTHATVFMSEGNAIFSDVLTDLSNELRRESWSLDYFQLKYMLQENKVGINTISLNEITTVVFECLLSLGEFKTFGPEKIAAILKAFITSEKLSADDMEHLAGEIIAFMVQSELVFRADLKRKKYLYSLSAYGYSMTAKEFAKIYVKNNFDQEKWQRLSCFHELYQKAVVERLAISHPEKLKMLMQGEVRVEVMNFAPSVRILLQEAIY